MGRTSAFPYYYAVVGSMAGITDIHNDLIVKIISTLDNTPKGHLRTSRPWAAAVRAKRRLASQLGFYTIDRRAIPRIRNDPSTGG